MVAAKIYDDDMNEVDNTFGTNDPDRILSENPGFYAVVFENFSMDGRALVVTRDETRLCG